MNEAKEKAIELVEKFNNIPNFRPFVQGSGITNVEAKQCALICVENEYHALREMLFSLRASRVIESERVYLSRLDRLIEMEKQVKEELNKL